MATTIEIHVTDELRRRMDEASGEDWSQVVRQAIEKHLGQLARAASAPLHTSRIDGDGPQPGAAAQRGSANTAYDQGYTWARDRAVTRDLRAMVNAANYRTAVDIVCGTKGFSQRDSSATARTRRMKCGRRSSMAPPRGTTRALNRPQVSAPRLWRSHRARPGCGTGSWARSRRCRGARDRASHPALSQRGDVERRQRRLVQHYDLAVAVLPSRIARANQRVVAGYHVIGSVGQPHSLR